LEWTEAHRNNDKDAGGIGEGKEGVVPDILRREWPKSPPLSTTTTNEADNIKATTTTISNSDDPSPSNQEEDDAEPPPPPPLPPIDPSISDHGFFLPFLGEHNDTI